MTITKDRAEAPRLLPAIGLFLLSLVPGLLAFLPGFARAVWNLTDPVQQTYLTPLRVGVFVLLLLAVFGPFIGAAAALAIGRKRTRSWGTAFRSAARWAAILGGAAFVAVMMTSGGF